MKNGALRLLIPEHLTFQRQGSFHLLEGNRPRPAATARDEIHGEARLVLRLAGPDADPHLHIGRDSVAFVSHGHRNAQPAVLRDRLPGLRPQFRRAVLHAHGGHDEKGERRQDERGADAEDDPFQQVLRRVFWS